MSMKATKFSIAYILGYLMTHPDTLRDNKYRFDIRDFPTGLTQVVYMAINNCAQGGCTVVTPQELLATVENSAKATKIFTDSNGSQYINDCYGLGKEDKWGNFEYHYSLLKKQSLLLSFKAQGFNISELWTENPLSVELDEKQTANLEKLSIDDIINFFEKKIDIQRSFYSENEGQASIRASEGMQALVESLKATPEMGAPMNSKILNTIYRGARLGKLYMRSGSSGCVDCDTEYFTGTEWKKISEYSKGDKVLQYNIETNEATLVTPLRYIKEPCAEMYELKTKYGIDQRLSEEHTVITYSEDGIPYIYTAKEFVDLHNNSVSGLRRKFKTTFDYKGSGISLTDNEIRLMIAIFADGSFYNTEDHDPLYCRFNLKKERKKERLEQLLQACGIEYKKKASDVEGYHCYTFYAPIREKHFPKEWYQCTKEQFKVIHDEVMFWDGSVTRGRQRFSSTSKEDSDFVQFVFACMNERATLSHLDRRGALKAADSKVYMRKSIEYNVSVSSYKPEVSLYNSNAIKKINKVPTVDGYKYCFEVPTHALVLRRNGRIFITGNSGKSRLMLADACKVAIPYIYNIEEKNWTVNEFSAPTLFITTELEVEEIQTMIIAYVSGVDETHILDGKYEEGEEDRVHKAIAAINASPLYLEQVPSFNMEDIERVIRKHKTTNDVQYIFFDYVFISGKMITEMAQKSRGIKMREDNVLYLFMERMKFLCNKYHIHINTASQLNGEWKNVKTADETVLRGAKAMADKLDCGAIVLRVTELDKEMLAPILESTMYKEPNLVYNIYKVRRGRFTKVKLWVYFDYGTLRTQDLFVTTNEYEIIPIESTNLDQILEKYATSDFPLTLEEMGVASPNTEDDEDAMDDEDEAENMQPEEAVNNGGEDEVEW